MSTLSIEVLEARIALLERRLQLLSEEVSAGLAATPAAANGEGPYAADPNFDADSLSPFSQGFFEREYDDSGKAFRWTGNGPICELRFFLDRGEDRRFKMAAGSTPPGVLAQLSGFVDYAPIALAVEKGGQERFVTGTIPKRAHTRLAVVTFLLGRSASKKKSADANDQWLGFRFYAFAVA